MNKHKVFSGLLILGLLAPIALTVNSRPAQARDGVSIRVTRFDADKGKDGGGTPRPTPPPGPPK